MQISFSLTSPVLSNKKKYPNIYRINPSENIHNPAILALANRFKWKHLFIIKHELSIFNSVSLCYDFILKLFEIETAMQIASVLKKLICSAFYSAVRLKNLPSLSLLQFRERRCLFYENAREYRRCMSR